MERVMIRVRVAPHGKGLQLPRYMTPGSAGMDLRAAVLEPMIVRHLQRVLVPTGIHIEIPIGYEGQVRPRSGLALESGLTVLNAPGTIDSDYRGEIKVIVINLGAEDVVIERDLRIAQLVIAPVVQAELSVSEQLDSTGRADGGFGHTGHGM